VARTYLDRLTSSQLITFSLMFLSYLERRHIIIFRHVRARAACRDVLLVSKKGGDDKYMRESEILKYVFLCLGCCDMAMDLPWAD
jgi:hypothetical protein